MGFLSNLLGMTGPGRLGVALNALTAKYMLDQLDPEHQQYMHEQIIETLMQGSARSQEYAKSWVNKLEPTAYYGLAAQIFLRMNLPPAFPKCFAGGRWNIIDNPLIGLHQGDDEIRMARVDIFKRYQLDVELGCNIFIPKAKKVPHEIIITNMQQQVLAWVYSIFKPIESRIDRPLRYEYMVAFSGMLASQCYIFAMTGIQNKEPDSNSVVNFIQGMADHLKEDRGMSDSESFLQETMIGYRNLFNTGMAKQDMYELCEDFTYNVTLLEGLSGQIDELNSSIQTQCNILTQSIPNQL